MEATQTNNTLDPNSYRVQAETTLFTTKKPELGKNEFLTLLVSQLKNQNPLEPVKDADFIAQLATFSSLEQLQDLNKRMDSMIGAQGQLVNSQSMNLVGREVFAKADGKLQLRDDGAEGIVFDLPKEISAARVDILDENGMVVRTVELSKDELGAGRHRVNWDGKNASGTSLAPGMYSFRITATDATGTEKALSGMIALPVEGLNVGAGGLFLISGNRSLAFDDIVEIRVREDKTVPTEPVKDAKK